MTIDMTKRFIMESKNIRIATSGIYDYAYEELDSLGLTLPCGAQKKKIYKVYRPAIVMEKSKDKFKMLPLTHHHPAVPVDDVNFRDLVIGYTGDTVWVDHLDNRDEVGIRAMCVLYDSEALDAYERGEIQLSAGYHAIFDWAKGTAPDGQDYDIIMKDIISVNHVALLPLGRGGSDASIMDGAPEGNDNASKDHVKEEDRQIIKATSRQIEKLNPIRITENNYTNSEIQDIYSKLPEGENKTDGRKVRFVKSSLGKILRHKGFDMKKIIPILDTIYNTSIPLDFKEERKQKIRPDGTVHKEHSNFVGYHNYLNKIKDNGNEYFIRLTVQEKKTNKKDFNPNEFHSAYVSDIELYNNNAETAPVTSQIINRATDELLGTDKILLQIFKKIKSEEENNHIHDEKALKSIFEIYQRDIFEIAKAL